MNKYILPHVNTDGFNPLFVGDASKQRFATATDVVFVDKHVIIVAQLLSKKLYVIEISCSPFRIVSHISAPGHIDLMSFKNNILMTSNFPYRELANNPSVSLFRLSRPDLVLSRIDHIPLHVSLTPHSCALINDDEALIACTRNPAIIFINRASKSMRRLPINIDYRPKDILIHNNLLFILTCEKSPRPSSELDLNRSKIYVFQHDNSFKTFTKLDECYLPGTTDALCYNGYLGYVTVQSEHIIQEFFFQEPERKLRLGQSITGFSFPHGIEMFESKLIVTNYGDNSIIIREMAQQNNQTQEDLANNSTVVYPVAASSRPNA